MQLLLRNTWSQNGCKAKDSKKQLRAVAGASNQVLCTNETLGLWFLHYSCNVSHLQSFAT
jgi:hypothetical protein